MTLEERIAMSETHVFKTVFPDSINHHNTMFGGKIMMMMTETAFMTATRFSRKNFVIKRADQIDFKKPVPRASLVEFIGRVEKIGNTSLIIKVDIYVEKMLEDFRENVVSGLFTLVAIDENHQPTAI